MSVGDELAGEGEAATTAADEQDTHARESTRGWRGAARTTHRLMRIVITGAGGQLGRQTAELVPSRP
jgi:hypothetical protein